MFIRLYFFYGCFYATMAESNHWDRDHMTSKAPHFQYLSLYRNNVYFLHTSLILNGKIRCMTWNQSNWIGAYPLVHATVWLLSISQFPRIMDEVPTVWDCWFKWSHWDDVGTFNSQGQMVKSHSSQRECSCQKPNMRKNYSNCFLKLSKFL